MLQSKCALKQSGAWARNVSRSKDGIESNKGILVCATNTWPYRMKHFPQVDVMEKLFSFSR